MNSVVYNNILDKALESFSPGGLVDDARLIKDYEVRLNRYFMGLLGHGVLKIQANKANLAFLEEMLLKSIRIAWRAYRRQNSDMNDIDFEQSFMQQVAKMRALSNSKNNDYSPYNIYKGMSIGLAARMGDKISRIGNAIIAGTILQTKDEKLIDTALDLVNYSIYAIMVALDQWVTDEQRVEFVSSLTANGGDEMAQFYQKVGNDEITVVARKAFEKATQEHPGPVIEEIPVPSVGVMDAAQGEQV